MNSAQRLVSLDAFRGFTIAGMLLVNNPGDWGALYPQLAHAAWHGWTFTDWIFPFFLFISGLSMVLAIAAKHGDAERDAATNRALLLNLWRRAATIFALGLFLNFVPAFDLSTLRIPGVLQRIGLCAALAAPLVLYGNWRVQLGALIAACAIYTGLMLYVPVPDANGVIHTGSLEAGKDTGAYIDRLLLSGHLWAKAKTWDPEGLLSTLPAVSSLLAGVLTARAMRLNASGAEKTAWMLLAGLLALWVGQVMHSVFMPINKSLWTPSYMVFMTGWAWIVFGAFYWLMDMCQHVAVRERARRLLQPFTIYGMNAIFLFALSSLVAKALNTLKIGEPAIALKPWLYSCVKAFGLSPVNSSLAFALLFNLCFFGIAVLMWRKRWFVKI
jgi:predicted acyltransferase